MFIIAKKSQVWLTFVENRLLYKITYERNRVFAIFFTFGIYNGKSKAAHVSAITYGNCKLNKINLCETIL